MRKSFMDGPLAISGSRVTFNCSLSYPVKMRKDLAQTMSNNKPSWQKILQVVIVNKGTDVELTLCYLPSLFVNQLLGAHSSYPTFSNKSWKECFDPLVKMN